MHEHGNDAHTTKRDKRMSRNHKCAPATRAHRRHSPTRSFTLDMRAPPRLVTVHPALRLLARPGAYSPTTGEKHSGHASEAVVSHSSTHPWWKRWRHGSRRTCSPLWKHSRQIQHVWASRSPSPLPASSSCGPSSAQGAHVSSTQRSPESRVERSAAAASAPRAAAAAAALAVAAVAAAPARVLHRRAAAAAAAAAARAFTAAARLRVSTAACSARRANARWGDPGAMPDRETAGEAAAAGGAAGPIHAAGAQGAPSLHPPHPPHPSLVRLLPTGMHQAGACKSTWSRASVRGWTAESRRRRVS